MASWQMEKVLHANAMDSAARKWESQPVPMPPDEDIQVVEKAIDEEPAGLLHMGLASKTVQSSTLEWVLKSKLSLEQSNYKEAMDEADAEVAAYRVFLMP